MCSQHVKMLRVNVRLLLLPLLVYLISRTSAQPGMGVGIGLGPTGIDRREEHKVRNQKSQEIMEYMNATVDPCTDFYEYACGNWGKHNRKHMREGEQRTAQKLVQQQINKNLQLLLEEGLKQNDNQNTRKVKDFYNACVKVENPSSAQRSFLLNFIKMHGGLRIVPNSGWQVKFDWVQRIAQLRANYGLDILIGLEVDVNQQTMRGNSIYLGEPKTTLIPPEYCSTTATQAADLDNQIYKDIQQEVALNMQSWLQMSESDADRFAGDIVRFEFELCKHMRQDHSLASDEEEKSAAEGTERQTGFARHRVGQSRLHGLREQAPTVPRMTLPPQVTQQFGNNIDFQMFVDISLDTRINSPVYVRDETYLAQLTRVSKTFSPHSFAGYIMYRGLLELNFPREDNMQRRPQTCVDLVQRYFPKIIGEMYLRHVHLTESRNDLAEIFDEIIKVFEQRLQNEWLDENDRRAARQKLMQYKLSFPDYQNLDLRELHMDRMDYWRKLELVLKYNAKQKLSRLHNDDYGGQRNDVAESYEVRMQLVPSDQKISCGLGLVQAPFYNYFYPRALKYALLGQYIAQQLVYAFDDQGWNQNPQSTMRWRSETVEEYRNRSECFRAQYSNYLYNSPEAFRNGFKLREVIADSNALSIAFEAYLTWLDRMDPKSRLLSRETLTDLNYTNTQLFFIYFAQTHCMTKYEEEVFEEYLPLDRHQPERYSVNGPLSNYEEFGREFGCALGAEMNIDDKCVIY